MTEAVVAKPHMNRRSPLEMGVDRVWRFFCSVRAAVWEVAILALLVLIGTLAGSEVPHWIGQLVPPLQGLVDQWYGWNVFKSLPFAFMLGLLSVAIMICTLNRAPAMWLAITEPTVTTTRGFLNSAEVQLSTSQSVPAEELVTAATDELTAAKYRVLTERKGAETHIYADRHRYGQLGTFPFHLALILVLIGGIIGSRYGFRDTSFIVAEGSTQDVGHSTGLSVQLVDFQDTYTELGQPDEYKSSLVILRDGAKVKSGSITVNHPMSYRSTVFYQSSFGPAVNIKVADTSGQVIYEGAVPLGVDLFAKGNPDAPAGYIDLPPVGKRILIIGPDSNPTNEPELDKLALNSGEMYIEVRDLTAPTESGMPQVLAQGAPATVAGLVLTFERESQWSGMQVSHNPGIPVFWLSALLLIGGLAVVFYFPHRRIRGIIWTAPDGTASALLAPMARRDWSARRTFEQFSERLQAKSGEAWQMKITADGIQSDDTGAPDPATQGA